MSPSGLEAKWVQRGRLRANSSAVGSDWNVIRGNLRSPRGRRESSLPDGSLLCFDKLINLLALARWLKLLLHCLRLHAGWCWELQHGCALPLKQVGEKNEFSVREIQRIVMS